MTNHYRTARSKRKIGGGLGRARHLAPRTGGDYGHGAEFLAQDPRIGIRVGRPSRAAARRRAGTGWADAADTRRVHGWRLPYRDRCTCGMDARSGSPAGQLKELNIKIGTATIKIKTRNHKNADRKN